MNRSDIDYIVDKLNSYKPDNVYDGYNSEEEKQDQRVSEVLDSLKAEFESDYENGHTPMPKEWVLNCKLDKEQMEELKRKICLYTNLEPVEENQWIKCSVKMPQPMRQVLFYDEYFKDCVVGYFNKNYNAIQVGCGLLGINGEYERFTHWMSLPEPPGVEQ